MFDWDAVPDDIANYVAVERLSSEDELHEERESPENSRNSKPFCYELDGVALSPSKSTSSLVPLAPLVPIETDFSPAELETIRWMMQKVSLRQDMFLLGPPGGLIRHLVFRFCSLFQREVEYVGITADTSEADLKQRREIRGGHAVYVDQAPVRAALNGRVLVLEGIEKAERNVLPLLNNLLENREMQLEDGRFLLAPGRVEGLQASHAEESEDFRMVSVHEDFIVIAIGMPSRGNPLDPPLRSRFAGHALWPTSIPEAFRQINRVATPPDSELKELKKVLNVLQGFIKHAKQAGTRVPPIPEGAAVRAARLLGIFPGSSLMALKRGYPLELLLNSTALGQLATGLASQGLREKGVSEFRSIRGTDSGAAIATFRDPSGNAKEICLVAGTASDLTSSLDQLAPVQKQLVTSMMHDHAADIDMCLVGEKGVGKTMILQAFAEMLGYRRMTVFCFKDLMARDLLQSRCTDAMGQTEWRDSAIVEARTKAEAQGRMQQERENIEVRLREMRARMAEERKTRLEQIQAIFAGLGAGVQSVLEDRSKMTVLVGGLTALALGVYGARATTQVAGNIIERRLMRPPLVRETSAWTFGRDRLRLASLMPFGQKKEVMEKIVLEDELSERLNWTTNSLVNAKKNGTPFRHLLLHGPPGTGKTLFARTLARQSGLDYAIMSGGDVGPLGKDAVHELNKLFQWANNSRKGLILFIDEADAFLRTGRGSESGAMSEEARNTLSAFLHHTGTESDKFVVVLATNIREILDKAVLDRVDESFEFPLPSLKERQRMLSMFMEEHIHKPTKRGKVIQVDEKLDDSFLEEVAKRTEGFSGRQLAKLVLAYQAAVFGSGATRLTPGLAETVLQYKLVHREDEGMSANPKEAYA